MKKTNKLLVNALLSTVLLALSVPALADTSDGIVELTPGTSNPNGPLALNEVPGFDFGSNEIQATEQTYTTNADALLSVADTRGTGSGWNVTANITDFSDGTHQLTGAEFTLPAVVPVTSGNATKPADGVATVLNSVDQPILNAQAGEGLGQWDSQYDNAQLKVPSGNYAGAYIATIEWTLTDGPNP